MELPLTYRLPSLLAARLCVADVAIRRDHEDRSTQLYSFKSEFDMHCGISRSSVRQLIVIFHSFLELHWHHSIIADAGRLYGSESTYFKTIKTDVERVVSVSLQFCCRSFQTVLKAHGDNRVLYRQTLKPGLVINRPFFTALQSWGDEILVYRHTFGLVLMSGSR